MRSGPLGWKAGAETIAGREGAGVGGWGPPVITTVLLTHARNSHQLSRAVPYTFPLLPCSGAELPSAPILGICLGLTRGPQGHRKWQVMQCKGACVRLHFAGPSSTKVGPGKIMPQFLIWVMRCRFRCVCFVQGASPSSGVEGGQRLVHTHAHQPSLLTQLCLEFFWKKNENNFNGWK